MNKNTWTHKLLSYLLLMTLLVVMLYPLVWMFFGSFKDNSELYTGTALLPEHWDFTGYINGWKGSGQYTFLTYIANTVKLVMPVAFFTLASCSIVAYGFARFEFWGKKIFFALMIATMMLPNTIIIIPRYILFRDFDWLDTYLPFYMPVLFACCPFFIFMMVQFLRGIPMELDESARIDGCGSLRIFVSILLPLLKPALFSAAIFQTVWTWNDFYNPLIYINSIFRYPLSLGLRMTLDTTQAIAWNQVLAMAIVSVLPLVIMFFLLQKHFVEGISTTGLKG